MNTSVIYWLLASVVFVLVGVVLFRKIASRSGECVPIAQAHKAEEKLPFPQEIEAEVQVRELPSQIIIGNSPDSPLVSIRMLPSLEKYEASKPIDTQSGTSFSRLSAICQSVPSLLVASEASGKRLMEVVINGDLVQAADGNGLRAFTMGSKGIKENARLFNVENLQNAINAAAVWQIASVVVAQKHLADISKKLDEIKNSVLGISRFLDNQRKSRIHSTYTYLGQIYQSLQNGELPNAARHHLENCERDLLEIQHHLEIEYRQKADKKVEHRETFGTEDLTSDISIKIQDLDSLAINHLTKSRSTLGS